MDPIPFPADADGDGYEPPADCDDSDPLVHPGAQEVPYDGEDQDCDGEDLVDVDEDSFDSEEVGGDDCEDGDPDIHPDAEELCEFAADEDCDGFVDEGCATSVDPGDPGGFAWTCGTAPLSGLVTVWVALALASAIGRWRR